MKLHNALWLLMTALMLAPASVKAATEVGDDEIVYTYGDGNMVYGTGKVEVYEVALRLTDPDLVGASVVGLRIPMRGSSGISGMRGWLTKELKLGTVNGRRVTVPDVAEVSVEPLAGYVSVQFDEPCEIPAEGLYAGYSFFVDEASDAQFTTEPIVVANGQDDEGFYIHTSSSFRVWTNFGKNYNYDGSLAMQVILTGGALKANDARALSAKNVYTTPGQQPLMELSVANRGTRGIKSVQIDYEVAGIQGSASVELPVPVEPVYDKETVVAVPLQAIDELGRFPLSYRVTGVNGQPNEAAGQMEGQTTVGVFAQLPRHRAVIEEYTGLWCAFCPRGAVGLEEMKRLYPDDFIGISYHSGSPSVDYTSYDYEPMAFTTDFSNPVASYPTSWLDRSYQTDPFCGVGLYKTFGIDWLWRERCKEFAPAWIEVASQLNDDQTAIDVTSTVTFVVDTIGHPYQLAYVLVADSLYNPSWQQNNAYTADKGWPESMDFYVNSPQNVVVVHRDVAIARSSRDGLEGSLPEQIEAFQPIAHSFRFNLGEVVNIAGEPLVQDVQRLHVVALLIDSSTGAIVNANQAPLGMASAIDHHRLAGLSVSDAPAYDLLGRRVAATSPMHQLLKRKMLRK